MINLYWIPLGSGGHSVRLNGIVYEAIAAAVEHRPRADLFHTALEVVVAEGRYMIEMTPVPDRLGARRGVVAEGPVGLRPAGRLRLFRYEVRRWFEGLVPDLGCAVGGPRLLTADASLARAAFELLPAVPRLTWGRDELRTGDMWSCNSIISWVLTGAGLETSEIQLPPRGRAPGWDAGIQVARRSGLQALVQEPVHRGAPDR